MTDLLLVPFVLVSSRNRALFIFVIVQLDHLTVVDFSLLRGGRSDFVILIVLRR
jgi:hypothetical protein